MSNVRKEHLFEKFLETIVPEFVHQEFNELRIKNWIAFRTDYNFDEIGEVFASFVNPIEFVYAHYHWCFYLVFSSKFFVDYMLTILF